MSWPASIVVAVLTGAAGLFVSGFIANLAVGWYRISSFEGGSGYFVVAMALLGGAADAVIGLVGSRIVGAGTDPSFLKALGTSLGVVLAISFAVGGAARLLADVPPTIEGEELWLAVEVQYRPQEAVIDTRSLTSRPFSEHPSSTPIPSVPPLSLSPDEGSFVTFAYEGGSAENPVLVRAARVTCRVSGQRIRCRGYAGSRA